jgi:hypothetical protein
MAITKPGELLIIRSTTLQHSLIIALGDASINEREALLVVSIMTQQIKLSSLSEVSAFVYSKSSIGIDRLT